MRQINRRFFPKMINLRTFVASVLLINEQMKTLERFISSSVTTIVLLLIYAFEGLSLLLLRSIMVLPPLKR